jgi:disulfide bond formation protein DsbB
VDTDTWFTFFALLAVAAQGATVAILATGVSGRAVAWSRLRDSLGDSGLPIAAIVALTATIGSLYLSEGADLVPCKLCWYQRIAMYSLAVLLAVAAMRRDWSIRPYALVLTALGASISTYHYLLERFPEWESSTTCDPFNPCNVTAIWRFHYVSIPLMALSGFALVAAVLAAARPDPSGGSDRRDDEPRVTRGEAR